MSSLILPKELDFIGLTRALADRTGDGPIQWIDFAQVSSVKPSGLVSLACLINAFPPGLEIHAINARMSPAFRYLQDMDFFREFNIYVEEDFERKVENRAFARLVKIDATSDSSAIAKNLAKLVRGHAPKIHNDLFTCLEESVRNVIDWAGSPGFAAAQAQDTKGGNRVYNIAVCDSGAGIREVLNRNPQHASDTAKQAMEKAVRKGVTTASGYSGRDNFGQGLFQIDRIADTTGGKFLLATENCVRIRDGNEPAFTHLDCNWHGTVVELTLYLSGFRRVMNPGPRSGKLRFG